MIYKTPFYAATKALYGALSADESIGIDWFDSAVPIDEIEDYFKNQSEFAYGIFGAAEADCTPIKDHAIWTMSINIDVYSNYKGKKRITQILEALMNYLSSTAGWNTIQTALAAEDFQMSSIKVNALRVNVPIYGETGVWQSGSTSIVLTMDQI